MCCVKLMYLPFHLVHKPLESGDKVRYSTIALPALSPNIVTLLGLPEKLGIFFLTHRKAITVSFKPAFPGTPSEVSSRLRKPNQVSQLSMVL